MAKETLGYVRLQWTCLNCQTKNLGTDRFCASCGAPQPEDVQFEQAAQSELIKDEAEIARAKVGPDIHCRYCGSRNRADAKHCTQCGADLAEGTKRSVGQVVGALRTEPAEKVICPACGTPNEPNAAKCIQCGAPLVEAKPAMPRAAAPARQPVTSGASRFSGIVVGIVLLLVCAAVFAFFTFMSRTNAMTGSVQGMGWTRSIAVEALVPVTYADWRDEIPAGVPVIGCTERLHHTQDTPAANAEKVCGTPYVIDQGSGYGEVVQDCEYRVYEDYCEYQVEEWQQVDTVNLSGNGLNAQWPSFAPGLNERAGDRSETYEIIFNTEQGQYTYTTNNPGEAAQFTPGSRWVLEVNGFNAVVNIQPE